MLTVIWEDAQLNMIKILEYILTYLFSSSYTKAKFVRLI